MTGGVRCHDPDACCAGQKPCPSPGACGLAAPVGTTDLAAAIASSRDAYFSHRGHLQRTPGLERLFADAFALGAEFALDAPQPNAAPAATVYTMEALVPGGGVKHHAQMHVALPAGTKLYAAPQPNAALADWGDPAYREACALATALFNKHFANQPHYKSGEVTWSLCNTTAGVISQIDNMVCGLVEPTAPQPAHALGDGWMRKPLTTAQMEAGREAIFSTGNPFCPCDSKTFRKVAEWVERHHRIGSGPPLSPDASKEGRNG